ncbi:hypothetical protein NFI96_024180 [Prochilodus magdalenae]|nr:hypothetical protein NFI96_024180 [Prochilodus magdalenae]
MVSVRDQKEKLKMENMSASHSLYFLFTGVTPGTSFPEFNAVGQLDGLQVGYYNSTSREVILKAEWIKDMKNDEHWTSITDYAHRYQDTFPDIIDRVKQLSNQTGGIHTWQWMFGCELDDDGSKRGYSRYGYDGEDWLTLDLNTATWTAANAKAVRMKLEWEGSPKAVKQKEDLEHTCIKWLQKYVDYFRVLNRTVRPEVFLFQKGSSSPVVCHATGFYPKAVMISWKKNGEDLKEDVEIRETLPNQDGSFQKRSILTVPPEELDRNKYTCVVQHAALEKEMILQVSDRRVLSSRKYPKNPLTNLNMSSSYTGTHSLDYYLTVVTPNISVPEFTVVVYMDGLEGGYYNSDRKVIVTGDWIKADDDKEHWDLLSGIAQNNENILKYWEDYVMELFNQTEGIHTVQWMIGCELDDDGTKRGYSRFGYDGEDFLSLDVNTATWNAANIVAVMVKKKLDETEVAPSQKNFVDTICIEWLKKYVDFGKETLNTKVRPEVSLLKKDSSPVVCHATGFYPKAVTISWQKNGEDLDEDVELRETLPNLDNTFQKRNILTVSSEELDKHTYTCVIQHSSLEKAMVLQVNKSRGSVGVLIGSIIGAAVLVILVVVGVYVWVKRRNNPVENPMKMTMTETAINPASLTDGGQVSDLLLEVVLEVGFPSTTIQPLEVSESYFVFKTRMTSELLKLALEDLVQPPNPENTVGHSEEEPLDALVSPAEITPIGELLGVQREENPLESVQPLDDPWSTAEDMQDIGKLLLMILLEDTSGSVQALPQKERVLSNIIAALQQNFQETEEEPSPLEEPLDGLVSSSDLRDQLVRELLDIQREFNPSESVQPLGVEKEKLPEVDPEKTTTGEDHDASTSEHTGGAGELREEERNKEEDPEKKRKRTRRGTRGKGRKINYKKDP